MERVLSVVTLEDQEDAWYAYWAQRSPEERIREVDRLRRIYISMLPPAERDGISQRLRGFFGLVERK